MTPVSLKNSSSNPSYLNFNGTAKELHNQVLTPVAGTTADIYKNFIVVETPTLIHDLTLVETVQLLK